MELPDTAEAARQLAVLHTKDTAVIASRRCIYLYNLKVYKCTVLACCMLCGAVFLFKACLVLD